MMRARRSDGIGHELLTDYLWKIGIVAVIAAVVITAMIVIWRRAK